MRARRGGYITALVAATGLSLWLLARFLVGGHGNLGASLWLLVQVVTSGRGRAALLFQRLSVGFWAGLILIAALSIGMAALRRLRVEPKRIGDAALFGAGLGLGLISTATLLLGSLAVCGPIELTIMLVAFAAAGAGRLRALAGGLADALRKARRTGPFRLFLWAVLGIFLLLNLARACTPPHDYDSLEYHVGAPAMYDRAGRVEFLERNVYASFPQNVEMLHFLGMRLTRSPDKGAQVGQMLGAAMGFMAALALYRMLVGTVGKEAGLLSAAFFYTWPGVTFYSGMPFVELPLIFYATLAAWGVLWSVRRRRTRPGPLGWVALAGAAAGSAMGVKYTAALLVFLPLLLWAVAWPALGGFRVLECARRGAIYGLVATACFSPWLIRNAINTGNPVYPLLYHVFDGRNWTEQKDARWKHAHRPQGICTDRPLRALTEQAQDVLFFNQRKATVLLLLFAPFCLLVPRSRRAVAAWAAGHWCLLFLLYFLFTQWNSRFLDAGVPLLAALSGIGAGALTATRWALVPRAAAAVLLLFAPSRAMNYRAAAGSLAVMAGALSVETFFQGYGPYGNMQFLNANLPENARVLFLGEARTFYCRRDFVASTVFDSNALEEIQERCATAEELRDELRAAGITHIYADTFELYRLQTSYRYRYRGEGDPAPREYLGMLDGFDWELFGEFAEKYLDVVRVFRGPSGGMFPWRRWNEFREAWERKRPFAPHCAVLYAVR